MKNIQVIDEAINARYAIYAVTDDELAFLFPGDGQDIEFIQLPARYQEEWIHENLT